MKTILLALALALTSLELRAQTPSNSVPAIPQFRPPRFGLTNGPARPPRYQPASAAAPGSPAPSVPGQPAATPGAAPGTTSSPAIPATAATAPSPAAPSPVTLPEEMIPAGTIDFKSVDLEQVLDVYAKLVNRTLLRANLPDAKIVLKTQTPLTKTEAIEALQAVLALNNVSVINIGDKFVKVVQSDLANGAGAELDRSGSTNLPSLGTYVTHITQLHYVKPSLMVPIIQPFGKLQNSITPIDDNGILVIRDYAENVKRMLELIEQIDVSVPAEYVSEVIPIRYAKVDDIASALNSLGGTGGGTTVSIGSSPSSSQISGLAGNRSGGMSGMGSMSGMGGTSSGMGGNNYQSGGIGGGTSSFGNRTSLGAGGTAANPNGTPTAGGSFASRLNSIINRAANPSGGGGGSSQDQIVLFGQTKIIPNESSSSLLIYATRADLEVIKGIIAKLDVPLSQVLIEAVIIDVTLGNTFNFGVSAAQNPAANGNVIGGGGMNNGQSFANFVKSVTSTTNASGLSSSPLSSITSSLGTNSGSFTSALPSGSSYFANIGPNWDVAVTAAETDTHASIIQRPRIQTSQAKAAQFFVGETKPYVTSTYNNSYSGGYGGSSYSQLSVGVELDVTPFINPEGMVSMDIMQEIDDFNGTTTIAGVGDVPNTIKRTLNASITVRDRDTVMLGGFIKSDKAHSQAGVPFLSDIPILGNLFKQRSDSKDRQELIVLMRPTVLATPELAAKHTINEEQRLPGISQAAGENAAEERKLINAQRKREQKQFKNTKQYDGFYVTQPEEELVTNTPAGPLEQKTKALNSTNAPH
jgi:general secretion pathway protein D